MMSLPGDYRSLDSSRLISRLEGALGRSAYVEGEVLELLSEVDARKVYAERGYPSMFEYCTRALHLSESMAYARIGVARAAREFPVILVAVRRREIHLAGLRLLVPHLTLENHLELLKQAKHKTRDEIAVLLADRSPKADAPSAIRRLPARKPVSKVVTRPTSVAELTPRPAPKPEPLGLGRFKVQFTADAELHQKLREAQALLRHQIPDGDPAKIMDRALTLLLAETKRKKFGQVKKPREANSQSEKSSRHIPSEIKREVVQRGGLSCSFVGTDGRKCESRDFLEFDHQELWSRFQRHRASEIRLLCRTHNQYAAELALGDRYMEGCRNRPRLDPDPVGVVGGRHLGPVPGYSQSHD